MWLNGASLRCVCVCVCCKTLVAREALVAETCDPTTRVAICISVSNRTSVSRFQEDSRFGRVRVHKRVSCGSREDSRDRVQSPDAQSHPVSKTHRGESYRIASLVVGTLWQRQPKTRSASQVEPTFGAFPYTAELRLFCFSGEEDAAAKRLFFERSRAREMECVFLPRARATRRDSLVVVFFEKGKRETRLRWDASSPLDSA